MVKNKLEADLKRAVIKLGFKPTDIVCSISENEQFGDYTSNVALQLAKQKPENSEQNPKEIANDILEELDHPDYLEMAEVAGAGFLNFFIKKEKLGEDIKEVLKSQGDFGKNDSGLGKKTQVEFISANPTGPLTLANGRGGAIGDSLANILVFSGYEVEREYYVNDTGNQVRLLGESILSAQGKVGPNENHYKGDYIKDMASKFQDEQDALQLGHKAADYFLEEEIKPAVEKLGIKFDQFYSERALYDSALIDEAVKTLTEKDLAYEKDGALWFRAAKFGDEKDRVLVTSENERGRKEPTYFLADIAHHIDVHNRHFKKRVNILGADHHSYAVRLKSSMEALGINDFLEVILFQLVRLFRDGKEYKVSKRAGTYITLDELLGEISPDVAKFFFLMYSANSHIDFNLDLAKEQSQKNPVYYVQYAHARMAGILEKGASYEGVEPDFTKLMEPAERELIKYLLYFPDLVLKVSRDYQVNNLTEYSLKLADKFHKFYEACPVLAAPGDGLKAARLALVRASKIVLANNLKLLGVSAPEKM
jgi:arginyl-tRNA synthetase